MAMASVSKLALIANGALAALMPLHPALAQSVRISVVTPGGDGVRSIIWRRVGTHEDEPTYTDDDGVKLFTPQDCKPDVSFKIKTVVRLYVYPNENKWLPCKSVMREQVQPFAMSGAVAAMLTPAGTIRQDVLPFASLPDGAALQNRLEQAVGEGDWASFAKTADEVADAAINQSGRTASALQVKAAAVETGATLASIKLNKPGTITWIYEGKSGLPTKVNPRAQNVLTQFQNVNGLESTGTWDAATYAALKNTDMSTQREPGAQFDPGRERMGT